MPFQGVVRTVEDACPYNAAAGLRVVVEMGDGKIFKNLRLPIDKS